jgi:hypothetical protein
MRLYSSRDAQKLHDPSAEEERSNITAEPAIQLIIAIYSA